MVTKIQKWGNSLAVRLSKEIVEKLQLREGSGVEVSSENGAIVLRPQKKTTLDDLLAVITEKNKHQVFDWGEAQGKELW